MKISKPRPGFLLIIMLAMFGLALLLRLGGGKQAEHTPAQNIKSGFMQDIAKLDTTIWDLQRVVKERQPAPAIQNAFRQSRLAYKRVEFLSAYFSPETTRSLNGPNIPEVDDDFRVNAPQGYQVLEELLFPVVDTTGREEALQIISAMRSNVNRLRKISENNLLTDSHVFDAMRLEVFRIITLGITGFDSPAAFHSLPEAASALDRMREQLGEYHLGDYSKLVHEKLNDAFERSISGLQIAQDFDSFDRLEFISQRANTLSSLLLDAQNALKIPVFKESRLLSSSARTLTDSGVFDPNYFVNFDEQKSTKERVALGKMLFFNPLLSGNGSRSCVSCHQPERAFTDGEPKSMAISMDGRRIGRNAPTLFNAAYQAVQFADSRVAFLEDQASDVIRNKEEMHGSLPQAVKALRQIPNYQKLFAVSYKEGVTEHSIKNAIASYIRSLTSVDSRLDRYFRNQPGSLTQDEKLGFNVFMGKGKCATCHFFPLFNGTVPPSFQETESEVIGVPKNSKQNEIDNDLGKFILTKQNPHRFSFKTPTVRHVAKTAPYMHNGVFTTLDEVVNFYNDGGGNGLGFNLENQTLPFSALNLSDREKRSLVAFMKVL